MVIKYIIRLYYNYKMVDVIKSEIYYLMNISHNDDE